MKIVIGCSSPIDQGSGILTYCKNLTLSLKALGHEILFVSVKSSSYKWFDINNILHFESDINGDVEFEVRNLYLVIRDFNPDVIINNDNCYLQQLAPAIDSYFIFVLHLSNFVIGELARLNNQYVDRYIAISTDMKFDLVRKFKIPSNKIMVVLNGLFLSNIAEYNENKKSIESRNNKQILCAGENSYRKGGDIIIKLFRMFFNDAKGYHFLWTADADNSVKSKFKKCDFIKIIDKLPKEEFEKTLSSSCFLLLPSREEGCPMVLLEAMRFGVIPIVSNGKGAMREIVRHGVNGFICDLNNWCDEVYSILKNPPDDAYLKYMSNNARETFFSSFANNEYAKELISSIDTTNDKNLSHEVTLYRWHRLGKSKNIFATLMNKFCYRFGLLIKIRK